MRSDRNLAASDVGTLTGLHFSQASVYWHLHAFPSTKAAEAVKSATGIVVEEDGRVWLSEFGPRNPAPRGGEAIAIVGPLQLPAAKSYAAVLSYAVMRPGDNSRVHTHPGPEGWVTCWRESSVWRLRLAPSGLGPEEPATVRASTPMELNVTGTTLRRAFALVIHDSAEERGIPSDWKPSGACSQGIATARIDAELLPRDIHRTRWFDRHLRSRSARCYNQPSSWIGYGTRAAAPEQSRGTPSARPAPSTTWTSTSHARARSTASSARAARARRRDPDDHVDPLSRTRVS